MPPISHASPSTRDTVFSPSFLGLTAYIYVLQHYVHAFYKQKLKEALGPLELEVQVAVSQRVGSGTWAQNSAQNLPEQW